MLFIHFVHQYAKMRTSIVLYASNLEHKQAFDPI